MTKIGITKNGHQAQLIIQFDFSNLIMKTDIFLQACNSPYRVHSVRLEKKLFISKAFSVSVSTVNCFRLTRLKSCIIYSLQLLCFNYVTIFDYHYSANVYSYILFSIVSCRVCPAGPKVPTLVFIILLAPLGLYYEQKRLLLYSPFWINCLHSNRKAFF